MVLPWGPKDARVVWKAFCRVHVRTMKAYAKAKGMLGVDQAKGVKEAIQNTDILLRGVLGLTLSQKSGRSVEGPGPGPGPAAGFVEE
jgi:hypothetical protein